MDFKVKQDNYNPLLKRKEVFVEVDHDAKGTPSRGDLRKAIATKYGTKAENVYVIGIDTKTGTQGALCEVQVYDDAESAKHTVSKHLQIRHLPPEERRRVKEEAAKKEEPKPKPEKPKPEKAKEQKTDKASDEKPKPEKPKAEVKQEEPKKP